MNTPPPPFREDTGSEKRSGQPKVTQPESGRGLTGVSPACPHHATWCRQQGARPAPHVAKGWGHWPVRPGDRNVGPDTGEETRARAASVAARQLAAGPLRGNTCSGSEGGKKLPPPQPPFIGRDTEAQEGASDQNPHGDPRAGRRLPARWLSPRPSGGPSEERAKPALPGPARTWRRAALTGPFCSSVCLGHGPAPGPPRRLALEPGAAPPSPNSPCFEPGPCWAVSLHGHFLCLPQRKPGSRGALPGDGAQMANHQKAARPTRCSLWTEPGAETELVSE